MVRGRLLIWPLGGERALLKESLLAQGTLANPTQEFEVSGDFRTEQKMDHRKRMGDN